MGDERTTRFSDRPEQPNQVEIADLGGGLYLTMDMEQSGPDPDPCLVGADLISRVGYRVSPARLALLTPAALEELYGWAASELVHRAIRGGRLARRPSPEWLAGMIGPPWRPPAG